MIDLNTQYMLNRYHYIKGLTYTECKKQGLLKEYNYFLGTTVVDNMDNMVTNLMTRIQDKVGNITDTYTLHVTQANENEGYAINGTVKGDKGSCNVRLQYPVLAYSYDYSLITRRSETRPSFNMGKQTL